ncbi:MepB family protein [Flavobacterium alvei]|uniref:MepB family protein n=1 Tax=Flavobacterium alvei TaxID=2080416 RepID=A0A2S5ABP3_9FLAO|nr:MepB family protein [Flavobacterium alvei]POY39946.1 MepB family protein [Flavobacterium alvei]
MTNSIKIFSEIELLNNSIFKVCGIELENIEPEKESQEYFAHNFKLNKQKVKFRMAKITPTKTGQFVAIWKRNENGITEPHNVDDEFEFYLIATRQAERFGIFIFDKRVLSENRILTRKKVEGKRGIRVYPNWSVTENKQAQKTQNWQTKYFVEIIENETDLNKVKKLLKIELKQN